MKGQRFSDAEQVGDRFGRVHLNGLAQDAHGAVDGDRAGLRTHLTGDQLEERRFPYAIAADKTRPFRAETQFEIGKEGSALRRGPCKIG